MLVLLLLLIVLIDTRSSIQIEQSPKEFKIDENSPNGTIVGTIRTSPSNYQMTLIDDAHGRFLLDGIGQLIVSVSDLF